MLRRCMTILLIIVVWFVVAYFVGCKVGRFIHDTQNERWDQHNGTKGQGDNSSESSIKHIHHAKEINHDSRETSIKHGKRTH